MSETNYISATIPAMPDAFKPARLKVMEAILEIEDATCRYYGIEPLTLHSDSRKDDVVMARHIVRYLLNQQGYGIRTIARGLGKDASQVSKSIKKVKWYVRQQGNVKREILAIKTLLSA